MRTILGIFMALTLASRLEAQVDVCEQNPGGTIVDQTWTAAGSPYVVDCEMNISGLTIEAGTRIELNGSDAVLRVNGVAGLLASGDPGNPIVFTSVNADGGGILFDNTAPGSVLRHCIVERMANSGIRLLNSVQTIEDCVIRENTAPRDGGGVLVQGDIDGQRFVACDILGNGAGRDGGGVACFGGGAVEFDECALRGNTANFNKTTGSYQGGAIYSESPLEVTNCRIESNLADSVGFGRTAVGGGIYLESDGVFRNCVFAKNKCFGGSETFGAGMYLAGGSQEIIRRLENCLFDSNLNNTSNGGAGLFSQGQTIATNCTFYNNNTQGIYVWAGGLELRNSIVFFNFNSGRQIGVRGGASVTVAYSCVQNGFEGEGNIRFNPSFASPQDLRIVPGSPCIDAGDPDPAFDDVCFPPSLGTPRNDIGAHGGPGACDWDLPGDCNGNLTDDSQEIASGSAVDCDADGVPDSCQIAENPDLDGDDDGLLDTCAGRSVRLVRADAPGLCFDVVVTSDVPFRGGEVAIGLEPEVLQVVDVVMGRDFPAGGMVYQSPEDPVAGPLLTCDDGPAGIIIGWVNPGDGTQLTPAGEHALFQICLDFVSTAPLRELTSLNFPFCLGEQSDFPVTNILTAEDGRSLPLHPVPAGIEIANFRRGDANDDGDFDISDAIIILVCQFEGGVCPDCPDAADVNDDGLNDMSDAIALLTWRFLGGAPPHAPFPGCGRDPTDDDLAVCVYRSCF